MTEPATIPVSLRDVDGVALVTFDDGKANALSFTAMDLLQQTLAGAAESAGAVVLAGRPGMFSAGLDLKVIRSGDPVAVSQLLARLEAFLDSVAALPAPVVAACTGHALAGGALLLLATDYRIGIADETVKIGLTETAVGIPMPDFAQHYAVARLDRRVLLRATALAEVVSPDRAAGWGYLDETAAGDDVVPAALATARRLRDTLDPAALAATKKLVLGR